MPAHHKLEHFIDEYLAVAGIREDGKTPLFRSAIGKTGVLTDKPMNRIDAYRMIRRRTAEAGYKIKLGCHVFRATGITAYLRAGGTLENAQAMAAHESPRTTKLYDRTSDEITLDEVERITIRAHCATIEMAGAGDFGSIKEMQVQEKYKNELSELVSRLIAA